MWTRPALYRVVDVVDEAIADHRVITVGGVARALGVDQPRASRLVAEAVAAGLVRREADAADGRRSVLALTPDGQRLQAAAAQRRRDDLATLLADWPDGDRQTFARLLSAFVTRWQETFDESDHRNS
jgi:DNA-binding MarR family transcriptional regulator